MAPQKVVVEGSSGVTASQLKDFFRQIEDGSIDGVYMQAVLAHRIVVLAPAKPPTLVLHKTTSIGDVEGKRIDQCLTSDRWAYRDDDIDSWLPAKQSAQAASSVGVYQLQNPQGTTFREMALAALAVSTGTRNDVLAKLLKERGLTLTLSAIDELVERQEGGEDVGLRTDGWANFAFVEDSDGSVSVLGFDRLGGRWYGDVYRLDHDYRWLAEYRLLLRNSDTSTL